jgi:glutathione S-transferase
MTMKLLTASPSPFGRKVKVVAIEKGLMDRIEVVMISTAPSAPNEQLARENPLIKIPTLLPEGGPPIPDSFVICDYLDSLHGGERVIPASGPRRWEVLTVHTLGHGICEAGVLCRYENVLRPEQLRWPDWFAGQMRKIDGSLDWLESNIAAVGKPGAANVDIGQVAVGCGLGYLDFRFAAMEWRTAHPRLADWFGEFRARASMQRTIPSA